MDAVAGEAGGEDVGEPGEKDLGPVSFEEASSAGGNSADIWGAGGNLRDVPVNLFDSLALAFTPPRYTG